MKKVCPNCSIEKEIDEFSFHNKTKGTYRKRCKVCYNALRKQRYKSDLKKREQVKATATKSYSNNKKKAIERVITYQKNNKEKVAEWQKKNREKNQREFFEYKSTLECSECGEDHPATLDFHHIDPTNKEKEVTRLIHCRRKLKEEIKKCIVLCANCHRKLHYEEKNNTK